MYVYVCGRISSGLEIVDINSFLMHTLHIECRFAVFDLLRFCI